jgi:hypothetical protein
MASSGVIFVPNLMKNLSLASKFIRQRHTLGHMDIVMP